MASSVTNVKTTTLEQDAIKKQMEANSQAWHTADDATKKQLEQANKDLANKLGGLSFDAGSGTWGGTAGSGNSGSSGYTPINSYAAQMINDDAYYDEVAKQQQYINANPPASQPYGADEKYAKYGDIIDSTVRSGYYTRDAAAAQAAADKYGVAVTPTTYNGQDGWYLVDRAQRPTQEGNSGADEGLLSDSDYAIIQKLKQDFSDAQAQYNAAVASGNTAAAAAAQKAMDNAHLEAERIRAGYNYSGGQDGSMYIDYYMNALSGKMPANTEQTKNLLSAKGLWSGEEEATPSKGGSGGISGGIGDESGGSGEGGFSADTTTPGYKSLLDEWRKAAEEQNNAKVDYAVQQAVAELERALEDSEGKYKQQQESVYRDEMQSRDNAALYAEARGDKGGIGEEQYSSIMNTAAQNRLAIQQAQTKLATDTQRQIADLRAQGEFEKADGLLEIAQTYLTQLLNMEQWAAEYGLSVAQFQESIRQWEAEYQLAVDQFNAGVDQFNANLDLSRAELLGSFSDGTQTLASKNQINSQLASLGESLLNMGIMPTTEQLAAMGMTTSQAKEVIEAVKLQQAAKNNSSSSSSSGGPGSGGDEVEVETGSGYDDLFTAAMESGYPKSYIANNYTKYGFKSSTGLYEEYQVWAEEREDAANRVPADTGMNEAYFRQAMVSTNSLMASGKVELAQEGINTIWEKLSQEQRNEVIKLFDQYGYQVKG